MGLRKTEGGLIVICDPGADKPLLEVKTLQCVHCGGAWAPKPGSGRIRGWCMNCAGPVCGPGCAECVPLEVYLESMEKGVNPNDVKRFVAVHVYQPPAASAPAQSSILDEVG